MLNQSHSYSFCTKIFICLILLLAAVLLLEIWIPIMIWTGYDLEKEYLYFQIFFGCIYLIAILYFKIFNWNRVYHGHHRNSINNQFGVQSRYKVKPAIHFLTISEMLKIIKIGVAIFNYLKFDNDGNHHYQMYYLITSIVLVDVSIIHHTYLNIKYRSIQKQDIYSRIKV